MAKASLRDEQLKNSIIRKFGTKTRKMGKYVKRFLMCFFCLEVFGTIIVKGIVYGLKFIGLPQLYDFFSTHSWANRSLFYIFLALATLFSIIDILRHRKR